MRSVPSFSEIAHLSQLNAVDRDIPMSHDECVFVVDPDRSAQRAVRGLVETMNLDCETFSSGREFLESRAFARPGCAVLEVRIPDVNGLQIQDSFSRRGEPLSCVFLTSHATVSIAVRAMRGGAVNFIEKPFREHELWDTIKEAIAVDGERRKTWNERHDCERRLTCLSDKEQSVLRMILKGCSPRTIATELEVCVRTVELRRRDLMKKLGLKSMLELVRFAAILANGHASVPAGFSPTNGPLPVEAEPAALP